MSLTGFLCSPIPRFRGVGSWFYFVKLHCLDVAFRGFLLLVILVFDKGKDTQARFGKKFIAALSFLQAHIDMNSLFFAIDESDSSRPPLKEKADLPVYQVILRRYFAIPNESRQ